MREIDFPDFIHGLEKVEKIDSLLSRRVPLINCRGITPRPANVGLRWGKVFPDNIPQIVDFLVGHDREYYRK